MKPLTIEELNNLSYLDWVWVIDLGDNRGTYWCKYERELFNPMNENFRYLGMAMESYGKTWLAYKNKEEAEGVYSKLKSEAELYARTLAEINNRLENGKIIELPTIISFPDTHPILGKITTYQVIWLSKLLGIMHEKYTTPEQAERRLAELKGEV